MHEMSLAESVLQIIEDAAHKQSFTRVKTIWLEIGQLACVEKESLRFCFDAVMGGSIAGQARLEIIETAGQGQCEKCARNFQVAMLYEICPQCGGAQIKITGGNEMRIKEIEVE